MTGLRRETNQHVLSIIFFVNALPLISKELSLTDYCLISGLKNLMQYMKFVDPNGLSTCIYVVKTQQLNKYLLSSTFAEWKGGRISQG